MPEPTDLDASWIDTSTTTYDLTADQQVRAHALQAASRIVQLSEELTVRDVEQVTVGTAERLAAWVFDGSYDWLAVSADAELVNAEDVASIARTMEGIRFTPVDIPLADAETPEQSAAIVDGNLRAMGLTIDELRTAVGDAYRQAADEFRTMAAPCGCRAYDPNLNHHTTAEHTNCGPGLPCGSCDQCISDRAYHGDRLAKEAGNAVD